MNRCTFGLLAVALLLPLAGCRQPVTNPGQRQALFDFRRPHLANVFGNQGSRTQVAGDPQLDINAGYGRTAGDNQFAQNYSDLSSRVSDLNQRLGAYDSDNQLLHTEIASLQQKLQLANDYNAQLKQQLADTSGQFQQLQMEKNTAQQQLASTQFQLQQNQNQNINRVAQFQGNSAPTQLPGSATIRANNSLMSRLNQINIPGGTARMDGDVIRIEFPTDTLFVPGTYQVQPAQSALMQNLVQTIRNTFPRQIIGIEAHWDGTALNPPGTTDHQLTATQALAVFNEVKRLGLPAQQLFTMAMGSNRPRHPRGMVGGISPNRRLEIVIYPETFDGSF